MKAKALMFGVVVALVGVVLDIGMARVFHDSWTAEFIGNALTGAVAAYAFFRYMAYRVALSKQRAGQIAFLNHHIRNAMEAMVSSHYTSDDRQRLKIMSCCCDRVSEALRRFTSEDNVSLEALRDEPVATQQARKLASEVRAGEKS